MAKKAGLFMNGVKFGTYHSFDMFKLILNSKEIEIPEIKKNQIDIPGGDGSVDMTSFFGEPKYKNRELKLDFTINSSVIDPYEAYILVLSLLHGTNRKIIFDDDSGFYYQGTIHVGEYKWKKGIATLSITCDCEPFKNEIVETVVSSSVNGTKKISLYNTRKHVTPIITADTEFLFKYDGIYYQGFEGTFTIPEIELKDGRNDVEVTGVGNVTFIYTQGRL